MFYGSYYGKGEYGFSTGNHKIMFFLGHSPTKSAAKTLLHT